MPYIEVVGISEEEINTIRFAVFKFSLDVDGKPICYLHGDKDIQQKNGPTCIDEEGTQRWYREGKLHREDGPAVIYRDGTEFWYQDGKLHCEDGPAIIRPQSAGLTVEPEEEWYLYGNLHRENGPAVTYGAMQEWWEHGKKKGVEYLEFY